MIKTFIIKKTVKIVKKELDKRGGAVKITKDVAGIVKSEVNKYDIPNKISGLTSKLKKK